MDTLPLSSTDEDPATEERAGNRFTYQARSTTTKNNYTNLILAFWDREFPVLFDKVKDCYSSHWREDLILEWGWNKHTVFYVLFVWIQHFVEFLTGICLNDKQKKWDGRAGFPFFDRQVSKQLESDSAKRNSGKITKLHRWLLIGKCRNCSLFLESLSSPIDLWLPTLTTPHNSQEPSSSFSS